jgi:urease accessory protein
MNETPPALRLPRKGAAATANDPSGVAALPGSMRAGRVALRFEQGEGERTHLARNFASYPFHLTRPLYFDAAWPGLPTVVLQSASGGLFQGDRLGIEVAVGAGAAAQVTTQSATKVHSMERDRAVQETLLGVAAGGHLEFIADTTILFPDSRVESALTLHLAEGASAILADGFLWHDPKGGGAPGFALMAASVAAHDATGRLVVLDRYRIERPAHDDATVTAWRAARAQGTLYAFGQAVAGATSLVEGLRAALGEVEGGYLGVSALPNQAGAVLRVLAPEGNVVREVQARAWRAARRLLTGREARITWRK